MDMRAAFKYFLAAIITLLVCSCKADKIGINKIESNDSHNPNNNEDIVCDTLDIYTNGNDNTVDSTTEEICYLYTERSQYGNNDLANLFEYLKILYAEYSLQNYQINGETFLGVYLLDFNNDNIQDVLVETLNGNGLTYFVIENVNNPSLLYDFSSFDRCNIYNDTSTEQLIINYTSNYGLITYSTTEINYIFLGDEIDEIKFVHFFGTAGAEEFYVESDDEKTMLYEEEFNELIRQTEQNLQFFSTYDYMTIKTSDGYDITFVDN